MAEIVPIDTMQRQDELGQELTALREEESSGHRRTMAAFRRRPQLRL